MTTLDQASLDRLTETERAILVLLAQGHTAKSIAAQTGRSVGSVNERLREARRKTGAASSRELARRVASPQENRDELIGMAPDPCVAPMATRTAQSRFRLTGAFAMILFTLAAAASFLRHSASPPPLPADSLTDRIVQQKDAGDPPRVWRQRLLAEPRDTAWAPSIETALRRQYAEVPGLGDNGPVVRITCARTLCEVAVQAAMSDVDQVSATWQELQDAPFIRGIDALGLLNRVTTFTASPTDPHRIGYLAYWSRVPAASASTRP